MNPPAMPRKDRLRRVVILCRDFARNLAYYRTGQRREHQGLLDPAKNTSANFWRVMNGNCIDVCVLEWCKLFADGKGKHYWANVVTDQADFQKSLLDHLGLGAAAFQQEIETMRRYRDKFLAHLDSDYTMNVPTLDVAKKAVWFFHAHIVSHEAKSEDLAGLPVQLDEGYKESEAEAEAVYRRGT
jgi:hypothetical protein